MAARSLHRLKSSNSGQGGDCVEVAANPAPHVGAVRVRDSTRPGGGLIAFGRHAFTAFLGAVRQG
ncbi:DUF397 domain-containing protein [Streptomyces sp. NPDC047046]|uniref:DUF397 domain-containing protein n=1 Tax=Streptomyces sp. NPDC047046 TaxID=3155378 RepID=UPI0033FEAC08